jgi:hypothetical protein
MPKKSKKQVSKKVNKQRKPNRYNLIQGVLSAYGKENGIKWGKGEFSKQSSLLNQKTKQFDIKFVAQNIDILYKDNLAGVFVKKEFPTGYDFAWWYFIDEIQLPIFDDVTISFTFDDGFEQFSFKGNRIEAQSYWEDACYRYFRVHYSKSPWAYFEIVKTDNKTYVDYKIVPGERQEYGEKPVKTGEDKLLPTQQGVSTETDKLIALEQEKQRTLEKVMELLKQGFTKDEIFKILGK